MSSQIDYDALWSEKQGRNKLVGKSYYLGMSITVSGPNICAHQLAQDILRVLVNNPKQGLEWSKNWGRVRVCMHPDEYYNIRFTEKQKLYEMRSIKLATKHKKKPSSWIKGAHNQGRFTVYLNNLPVTYEGALIMFERMIDEAVWCHYQRLRAQDGKFSNETLYKIAAQDVMRCGIRFIPKSAEWILRYKQSHPEMPVRLYGNVTGKNTVPKLIGGVDMPKLDDVLSAREQKRVVSVGVCVGKELHLGHLLLLGWADVVRRSVAPGEPLYFEANDYGSRMVNMLANLLSTYSLTEISTRLADKSIPIETLVACYRKSDPLPTNVETAEKTLLRQPTFFVQLSAHLGTFLAGLGFNNVRVVPDSVCLDQAQSILGNLPSGWNGLGFGALRAPTSNSRNRMIVLQQEGQYSASMLRASFMAQVAQTNQAKQIIYVDRDRSITDAAIILQHGSSVECIQTEGSAIGFNFNQASGTKGEAWTLSRFLSELGQRYHQNLFKFTQVLRYFVLSHCEVVPSKKSKLLRRATPMGDSFFDFASNQAATNALFDTENEYDKFVLKLRQTRHKLVASITSSRSQISFEASHSVERFERFLLFLKKISQTRDFNLLFPKPKIIRCNASFRRIREWMTAHSLFDSDMDRDEWLVDFAMSESPNTILELRKVLAKQGITDAIPPGEDDERIDCVYVTHLRAHGYGDVATRAHALKFLKGEYALQHKQCAYFSAIEIIMDYAIHAKELPRAKALSLMRYLQQFHRILFY